MLLSWQTISCSSVAPKPLRTSSSAHMRDELVHVGYVGCQKAGKGGGAQVKLRDAHVRTRVRE